MGTITNAGLDSMATLLIGAYPYVATGTDSTAEVNTDAALGAENTLYGSARKAATTSTSSTGIATWNVLFPFTGSVTVREIGIFSASSSGTMLYRRVLAANRTYADGDSMEITVTHTYARS